MQLLPDPPRKIVRIKLILTATPDAVHDVDGLQAGSWGERCHGGVVHGVCASAVDRDLAKSSCIGLADHAHKREQSFRVLQVKVLLVEVAESLGAHLFVEQGEIWDQVAAMRKGLARVSKARRNLRATFNHLAEIPSHSDKANAVRVDERMFIDLVPQLGKEIEERESRVCDRICSRRGRVSILGSLLRPLVLYWRRLAMFWIIFDSQESLEVIFIRLLVVHDGALAPALHNQIARAGCRQIGSACGIAKLARSGRKRVADVFVAAQALSDGPTCS